ncbi:MAG: MinD/ParA family protein [Methylomonas sp.]|nr:MinD/ParA family protein [Methylomonas sp.]
MTSSMENLNFAGLPATSNKNRSHVMVFTSGKGGVGKTCVTTNVAIAMAHRGAKVCVFDADTGLANINILLGLRPEFTLEHVLSGEKTIHDIVIKTGQDVAVVPGASGVAELANMGAGSVKRLFEALAELEAEYDYFLIDTAAGVAESVLQFVESAPFTFLLITPEPTSLTDAFSLLKLLNGRGYQGRLRVIVNMAADYPQATETYRRFAAAVDKYLELKVEYGGFVARDELFPKSVVKQNPIVEFSGDAPASRCLYALADNVLKHIGSEDAESGLADYWKNLLPDEPEFETFGPDGYQFGAFATELNDQNFESGTSQKQSVDELAKRLLAAMKNQTSDREPLENFIGQFIENFVGQFGGFPQIFKQLMFRWLEAENYEASRLQELVATLEALYMAKHQQPMHSLENSVARMVAQCQDSESRMRDLVYQLRSAYSLSFRADVFDARQEVLDAIREEDFSEEDFQRLLDSMGQAFEDRFKRRYQGQSDLLLESTAETLAIMADDEKKLQQQIDSLTGDFQQLHARREALLSAISQGQHNNLSFQSKTFV